jgi:nicotinamide-nucleotide amidase
MINTDNVKVLADFLTRNNLTISVAESCTGGNLASTLTSLSGASVYFDCGFVTYSNKAKRDLLSVNKDTITKYGAVSEHVALEMVKGVIKNSGSDFAVAITGIAGPSGGTTTKPVGMV